MIRMERDSKMFETLGHYGILSTEQIAKMFFPNTALTTVRRRLRKLEKRELIYRIKGLDNGGVAWVLTKNTAQKQGCMYPNRHFNRNTLMHDVALSEARYVLETLGIAESWVPEHVLKAQAFLNRSRYDDEIPFVPDALFSFQHKDGARIVALELELNGKHRKRYENILSRYQKKKTLWAVWYLVASEGIGKTLEKVWKEINGNKRNDFLMWSLQSDFLRDPLKASLRGPFFSRPLEELITKKPLIPDPALALAPPGSRQTTQKQVLL